MMQAQDFPLISHSPKRWADFVRTRTPILESIVALRPSGNKNWMMLGDDSLIAHAKWRMDDIGVTGKKELSITDASLYNALLKRKKKCPGIMERVGFRERRQHWEQLGDEELVMLIRKLKAENGVGSWNKLRKFSNGLSRALCRRIEKSPGIIDRFGFENTRRNWKTMGDEEVIAQIKDFMEREGIKGRRELQKADAGAYDALRMREKESPGIMEKIGFEMKRHANRDWNSMGDGDLIAHSREVIRERGICRRKELEEADRGLYAALLRRKRENPGIIDRIFSEIDSLKHADAVSGVLDALNSFGDEK